MNRKQTKAQRAIREALLSLLSAKNINKVTVSEITETAEICRGTFYLHYKDVLDLYEHVEKDLYAEIEELIDRTYASHDPDNLMNLTHAVTEYIMSNRKDFLVFIASGSGNLDKLKNLFAQKMIWDVPERFPSDFRVMECMFAISGVIGVLEEWLFDNIHLSQKEIAESLFKILKMFKPSFGGY